MARTVIRTIEAWDLGSGSSVSLLPGTPIASCRIRRNTGFGDVYLMEFEATGKRYHCPLAQFQPRTQTIDPFVVEEKPARNAVAV